MSDLPESQPTPPVAAAASAVPHLTPTESAPAPASAPVAEAVADAGAPVAEQSVVVEQPAAGSAPVRRKPAKRSVSDDTLEAWQRRLEQDRAAERRRQQAAAAKAERRQAFRLARQALERCATAADERAIDPALAALADDQLAQAVHAAPERVRTVIAATLRLLQAKR